MNKIPNKLNKFMCQLSGSRERYCKQFMNNTFNEYHIDSPIVKLRTLNKDYTLHLNTKFNNGYVSKIHGYGHDIANALFYGYYTVEDISAIDKISIRTATRLIHPRKSDKYYLKHPHIPHTIQLYNIQDDCFKHYRYDSSKHQYHLKLNNVFGKWKPKTVVDAVTFTHFNRLTHSSFFKDLRNKYKNTTHLQMLHQLLIDKQKACKSNLKHEIFMKLLDKYRNIRKTYSALYRNNKTWSYRINQIEELLNDYLPIPIIRPLVLSYQFYLFKHHYPTPNTLTKMYFTVTDAYMYAYLFQKLTKKYKDYKHTYHPDKYNLMTKSRWIIIRLTLKYKNSLID